MTNGIEIVACPPQDAARALDVLFSALPENERRAMVASLGQSLERTAIDRGQPSGLIVARDTGGICGAVFAQVHPGRTANLWPPHTLSRDATIELRLARAADAHLAGIGVVMAQSLFSASDGPQNASLARLGFRQLTQLDYMIAQARIAGGQRRAGELQFEPYTTSHRLRMAELIEATYADTNDCPELNGVRDADDVITGYQATGDFDPAKWFFVSQAGRDVGVLLLTEHAQSHPWELVYMGLLPHARRRGFGRRIVEFALNAAAQAGIDAVLLAVDARNHRGIRLYQGCGFRVWDRRIVFWKRYAPP